MSRLVYFDAASGASGDMILGAVVDLGLPLETLRGELGKLGLSGYRLEESRVSRSRWAGPAREGAELGAVGERGAEIRQGCSVPGGFLAP